MECRLYKNDEEKDIHRLKNSDELQ